MEESQLKLIVQPCVVKPCRESQSVNLGYICDVFRERNVSVILYMAICRAGGSRLKLDLLSAQRREQAHVLWLQLCALALALFGSCDSRSLDQGSEGGEWFGHLYETVLENQSQLCCSLQVRY